MRREFSQKFSDEVIALNCDDTNKLNVGGGMMMSTHHQIRRIYMKDNSPDYEDHDFNLPGYKIIPSGYMLLEFKTIFLWNINNLQIIVIRMYILI